MSRNLGALTAALCLIAGCGGSPNRISDDAGAGDGGTSKGGSAAAVDDCMKQDIIARRSTPDMLIVLDKSASMTPQGNDRGTDRWRGSADAVIEVTKQFDDKVHFGLLTYPAAASGGGGGGRGDNQNNPMGLDLAAECNTGVIDVELGAKHAADISKALGGMHPSGYTPTAKTLEAALEVISGPSFADQGVVSPKYILLVTDGDPNCSQGARRVTNPDQQARQDTIAAIKELTAAGVRTYVVGYQTAGTSFESQLDAMAAAGGTGETKHHSVESGKDLSSAFEKIAARALSCSYKLASPVDDPKFVLVTAQGKPRQFGNFADGWTIAPDMQTVTLTGAACDAVQNGAAFSVEVTCTPIYLF